MLSLIYMLNKSQQHTLNLLSLPCLNMPIAWRWLLTKWIPFTASMLNGSCPHWLVTWLSTGSTATPSIFTATDQFSKSKPKLCYDHWRGALSNERTGLSFTIVAGPHQHIHSQVQVPRDSWPYFTVSNSWLPQPGGPCFRIYIPEEQNGPVIPPGTYFPFHCLLWLAGLGWKHANLPPQRGLILSALSLYNFG
jgi:hypothetical protein